MDALVKESRSAATNSPNPAAGASEKKSSSPALAVLLALA
jgi:hypothetical protein